MICDEADEVKAEGLPDPFRVSRHKFEQVFASQYVILAGDEFKATGEKVNTRNEFGAIVAQQRVGRGKRPWDRTPEPIHEII